MVPAGNKVKRLSSVSHTTKKIHHHHHHHHHLKVDNGHETKVSEGPVGTKFSYSI